MNFFIPVVLQYHLFNANYIIYHNAVLTVMLTMNTDFHWLKIITLHCWQWPQTLSVIYIK